MNWLFDIEDRSCAFISDYAIFDDFIEVLKGAIVFGFWLRFRFCLSFGTRAIPGTFIYFDCFIYRFQHLSALYTNKNI